MNELIERLAEQATIRGEAYLPGDNGHPTPTEHFDKEKFAHLIVKESVKALWTEDCHVSDLAIIDFNEKKRKIFNHMGITE